MVMDEFYDTDWDYCDTDPLDGTDDLEPCDEESREWDVYEDFDEDEWDDSDGLTDAEADAMTLASAGWGTDEDYGFEGSNWDREDY